MNNSYIISLLKRGRKDDHKPIKAINTQKESEISRDRRIGNAH